VSTPSRAGVFPSSVSPEPPGMPPEEEQVVGRAPHAARALVPIPADAEGARACVPQTSRIMLLRDSALDSLAYLDNEKEVAAMRPRVEDMIATEAARGTRAPSAYASMLPASVRAPPPCSLPLYYPLAPGGIVLDLSRYEDVPLAPDFRAGGGEVADCGTALRALDCYVGHIGIALVNFGLHARFGPAAWRLDISELEATVAAAADVLRSVRKECSAVNSKRKADQLRVSSRLGKLQRNYRSLVAKNKALADALRQLPAPTSSP
jgi:Breast carcinoma amplified sequence 2 (BCAS2)